MARFAYSMIVFALGIAFLALGIYLVQELILKFIKFAVGLMLIFLAIPMIIGSAGWWRFGRSKVVRMYRD